MIDGAALGTLMIGLDSIRKEAETLELTRRRATQRSRPKPSTFRVHLANALRFTADRLDRRTPASLGSSS